jgi:uncharacterized protein YkwD
MLALAQVPEILSGPRPAFGATNCSSARPSLSPDAEEQGIFDRINSYRANNGLGTLSLSQNLMAAAVWKSQDLGANRYFDHNDLFRPWDQRIVDCGYTSTKNIAENLAAGNADATATFEQWRTSSGHNANLLNPAMKAIGIARAYTPSSPYGWYWTADFGAVVDGPATGAGAPSTAGQPSAPSPSASIPAGTNASPAVGSAAPSSAATPTNSSSATLSLAGTAVVSGTGDCLRVHQDPALASPQVACLEDGSSWIIASGPVTADGYVWWKLGALGWVVDRYLAAVPQPAG